MTRRKKISCRAFRRGKKYPAHQVADQKSPTPPSRVKWSAPKTMSVEYIRESSGTSIFMICKTYAECAVFNPH